MPEFRRLAVVNRGEAAMRVINAVTELNLARETPIHITTIAVHTDDDAGAWFVREADERVRLEPEPVTDRVDAERERADLEIDGPEPVTERVDARRERADLDIDRLMVALRSARADAVWAGWGHLEDHGEVAEACELAGLVFVGPPSATIRLLDDRVAARQLAERLGIPVAPCSGATLDCEAALEAPARLCEGERHLEAQVVADGHGGVWAIGVRDCSLRRGPHTILAESSCVWLSSTLEEEIRGAAMRLYRAAGYSSVGSVEFVADPSNDRYEFVRFNTSLQLEHPVTEATSGLDLVKLQLQLAFGSRLEGLPPASRGHAIEAVVRAHDPERMFEPAPGRIALFRPPSGAGLRVDTGVVEQDDVRAGGDSTIAKIVAWGRDRSEALDRLERALAQCALIVDGGATNRSFLLSLLSHPEIRAGRFDSHWLDRLIAADGHVPPPNPVALLHAAVEAYDAEQATAQAWFYATATRGRPETPRGVGHRVELRYRGNTYRLTVLRLGREDYRIETAQGHADVQIDRFGPYESHLTCRGVTSRVLSAATGPDLVVEVDGVTHTVSRDAGGAVRATGPAFVIDVLVGPGDTVAAGDALVRLETMKMESVVSAPVAGTVRSLEVTANMQVEAGAPLVWLQPVERPGGPGWTSEPLDLSMMCAGRDGDEPVYPRLRSYLLGYDLDQPAARRVLDRYRRDRAAKPAGRALDEEEADALELFVDIGLLYRPTPDLLDNIENDDPSEDLSSTQEHLLTYLASLDPDRSQLPAGYRRRLLRALERYGVRSLDRTPALEEALLRMFRSFRRFEETAQVVTAILGSRLAKTTVTANDDAVAAANDGSPDLAADQALRTLLLRVAGAAELRQQTVADLARELRFRYFEEPVLELAFRTVYADTDRLLDALKEDPQGPQRGVWIEQVVSCPQPMRARLRQRYAGAAEAYQRVLLEVHLRRYYRIRPIREVATDDSGGYLLCSADYDFEQRHVHVVVAYVTPDRLSDAATAIAQHADRLDPRCLLVVDLAMWRPGEPQEAEATTLELQALLARCDFGRELHRLDIAVTSEGPVAAPNQTLHFTYRQHDGAFVEEALYRNLHPMLAKRLDLWQLSEFSLERLESVEDVYLFRGVARDNPDDERLFAVAEVRDLTPVRDERGNVVSLPHLERMTLQALAAMRTALAQFPTKKRPLRNRVMLHVRPVWDLSPALWQDLAHWLAPLTVGIGLERVVAHGWMPEPGTPQLREVVVDVENVSRQGVTVTVHPPDDKRVRSLTAYGQKVLRSEQIGAVYPYELLRLLTMPPGTVADFPPGRFVEHDLVEHDPAEHDQLVPVERPYGDNSAHVVVGVLTSFTAKVPEGMERVVILGDPTKSLGSVSEPECRRINAAFDLAERMSVPVEWFALSAGARIAMDSGTENMDWIAAVLRRIIEFTQAGGEVNVVVAGINVGAQPYWNAEATMLMHTRGILVMTPASAMVLTGKQALDFAGGVSAEDNFGIGGYDRVMGPNGQAQYWAPTLSAACQVLFRHYDHTYVVPGESRPRRAKTQDPIDRDISTSPHARIEGTEFESVGDIFSEIRNPDRRKAFDIRSVMRAVTDQDHEPLERWTRWASAENAIVWDAHIGGVPVCLLGVESRLLARRRFVPADGPQSMTAGTLFPQSSRKLARALNSASGNRPAVVLANLSGFDGSPESMRRWQLEYGAEIGRAVTNFRGVIVFVVISRYHGGAFVVFSKRLNAGMEIAAVEGSRASVIGGAAAAATVFAREVTQRLESDPRVVELRASLDAAHDGAAVSARNRLQHELMVVRAAKLGELAAEFDRVHDVRRAQAVGSVDRIIAPRELRPYIVDALERSERAVES